MTGMNTSPSLLARTTSLDVSSAARDLLGYYNLPGGYAVGGFRSKLFSLWGSADAANQARLATAFPIEAAVIKALNGPDGSVEQLRRLAGLAEDAL